MHESVKKRRKQPNPTKKLKNYKLEGKLFIFYVRLIQTGVNDLSNNLSILYVTISFFINVKYRGLAN